MKAIKFSMLFFLVYVISGVIFSVFSGDNNIGYSRYYDQWLTHNSHELTVEIDCLNLLNSLYLSDVQMRHLIGVGVKMEKVRRSYQSRIEAINKDMEVALTSIRNDVKNGKNKTDSIGWAKLQTCENKMSEIRKDIGIQEVLCEMYVKAILSPNQREKCYNYEHCLIPVKNLKDPTKVGQADAGTVAEQLLDRIRQMSKAEMDASMPIILSKQFASMEKYMGEISDVDRKKEEAKIMAVFNEARGLSDLDYQTQKSRIASQIPCDYMEIRDRLKDIGKSLCKIEGERKDGKEIGVIGQMFLKPCMISILAKRMNILGEWSNYDSVDIDRVKAAAQCKNGSCAID